MLTPMLVTIGLGAGQQAQDIAFTVDTPLDLIDPDLGDGVCPVGSCSLRAAIMQANVTTGPGVTINVPSGTYTLTRPPTAPNGPDQGDLNLIPPPPGYTTLIRIVGAGASSTFVDANHIDRVLVVQTGRQASISGLTIRNGSLPILGSGGGIYNTGTLTLTQVTVTANQATFGGGLNNSGIMIVTRSTFSANQASLGGGLEQESGTMSVFQSTFSGNSASDGGGIYHASSILATTLTQSTLSSNGAGNDGGGINNHVGNLFVINSTLSQNTANNNGGGIANSGVVNIYNSSVVFNAADADADVQGGNGGGVRNDGTFNLRHTLVAGNTTSDRLSGFDECAGILTAYSWNLFWAVNAGCTVNTFNSTWGILSSLADLGPLRNNGGPTWTHALKIGSNAIDSGGLPATCIDNNGVLLTTDQRGFLRPVDATSQGFARCDIGAYEFQPSGFTDDPLIAGASVIRAVHIAQLRTRIDAQRTRFGLAPFAWTGPPLAAGTMVTTVQVSELRTALLEAITKAGKPAPIFTDSPLVPQTMFIRALHITELRDAVLTLEIS